MGDKFAAKNLMLVCDCDFVGVAKTRRFFAGTLKAISIIVWSGLVFPTTTIGYVIMVLQ